jgi:hypothetical protein
MNYAEAPDGTLEINNGKMLCPECGRRVFPFQMTNVANVPLSDHDWVCDAEWTDWQRNKRPPQAGVATETDEDWFYEFRMTADEDAPINGELKAVAARSLRAFKEMLDAEKNGPGVDPVRQDYLTAAIARVVGRLNGRYHGVL